MYRNSVRKYDEIAIALQRYGTEQGTLVTPKKPESETTLMIQDEIHSTYATNSEIAEVCLARFHLKMHVFFVNYTSIGSDTIIAIVPVLS